MKTNITSSSNIMIRGFTENKLLVFNDKAKNEFLKLYVDTPNITKVAKTLGVNRRTIQRHLKQDEAFKLAIQEIREGHLDEIEEYMMTHALTKGGFMDRIAYLKAHRDKFADKMKHEHKHDHREVIDKLYEKIPKANIVDV